MSALSLGPDSGDVQDRVLKALLADLRPRGLAWRYGKPRDDGSRPKRPVHWFDGHPINGTTRENWTSLENAMGAVRAGVAHGVGVGAGLGPGPNGAERVLIILDFDKVVRPEGTFTAEFAAEWPLIRDTTYCELSPSGTGVRAFHWAPAGATEFPLSGNRALYRNDGGGIEIYSWGRFATITGEWLSESAERIGEIGPEFEQLRARHAWSRPASTKTKLNGHASEEGVRGASGLDSELEDLADELDLVPGMTAPEPMSAAEIEREVPADVRAKWARLAADQSRCDMSALDWALRQGWDAVRCWALLRGLRGGDAKSWRRDYLLRTIRDTHAYKERVGAQGAEVSPEEVAEINVRLRAGQQGEGEAELGGVPDREHPPGLLGALIDHGEQRCPFKTRGPALAAALVGLASASSNRFAVHLGGDNLLALNLYAGVIGRTGIGKDTALSLTGKIAEAGGVRPHAFASEVALHQALAAESVEGDDPRNQLVLMDEWGRYLQQIKHDGGGHQRGMMTKLMEVRGLAIGGVMPERAYASKGNLSAVRNPFVNALFVTTPRTLHDALTSAEVVDGSLNRVFLLYLSDTVEVRPLDEIFVGPLSADLVTLVRRAAAPFADSERREIGDQEFILIQIEPAARAAFEDLRAAALKHIEADTALGSLWARAFENAAKLAGICALGEAIGTVTAKQPGKLIITATTAAWAIRFVRQSISETVGDLRENLSEHEAERIQKSILRAAAKLRDEAAAKPNPDAENAAPTAKQDEMRDLKRAGWFLKRGLVRAVSGKGRSSKSVGQEIVALIEGGSLAQHEVTWPGKNRTERRVFVTRPSEA